ncbi:valine--tRNA ligase [Pontivivens insulae]|uniref:Valine--tRNA ligase n=1 Tax=Pontivivens insulae TaxID=1639689 RepID=A0A2R8AA21_9RHOB|nr:valine--tRNA ligase [Pontivivens insulae]RED12993.1 valyl-tRNA synthetase [Pontivivens insulae]SPF29086.1 Valine--tRNA ligase [Pontivivens insulae]
MAMEKNFDAATSEAAIARAWEAVGAFRAGANAKDGAESFAIMIPPPNVTGSLHMGHAFNNTLQDILVRWHRMRGFDTLWQPGQDHAGIATQMVVERRLAEAGEPGRRELGREKFLEKVWEWKAESGGTIIEQLKRLGASCDWERNAFTMSGAPGAPEGEEGNFHDAVIKTFVKLYEDGLIYRGKRLTNWDPHFETAISDLEVENREVPGHMWHFKYPLAGGATYEYVEKDEDGNVTLRETRDYISIATTRPETMLGDGAVAVHPDDARYAPIVGKLCEIPVGPKETRRLIRIITDEYPDMNFGSGAVKITGAHDFNDYGVAKRNNIPLYRLMDLKAAMRADGLSYADSAAKAQAILDGETFSEAEIDQINLVPDEYRGLDRFDARKKIVAAITDEGLAVMVTSPAPAPGPLEDGEIPDQVREEPALIPLVENKPIMQPFGDRSGVVIEPMLTDQWFVKADELAKPAIEAVRSGETQILPERDAKVYFNWMENIEPWCISRQLWWGHRIPVWYGPRLPKDGVISSDYDVSEFEHFCAASEAEAIALAQKHYGSDVRVTADDGEPLGRQSSWYGISAATESGGGRVDSVTIHRDGDVLDTWFSSGLWPMGTLGWPDETEELAKYYPTSVLVTGFDIIFFWVARMMMMQKQMDPAGRAPFHTVYVHALVRDEKGQKMSKSKGNVLDPLELIDQFGADAVRFTLTSMAAMGRDLKLSVPRIEGYRNFGTKLWNATRFAEMNECKPVGLPDAKAKVNRWIIAETARAKLATDEALAAYRFNDAANGLYAHVWGTVCDWYVEFAKPLLQGDDEALKAETQATMAWALDQCLILLHPIMPFITEELWKGITDRSEMLVTTDWPTYGAELIDAEADAEIGWIRKLIEEIRSVRAEMNVAGGAKTGLVLVNADATTRQRFEDNRALVERLARVETVDYADAVPQGAVTLSIEGATICLPLAGHVDVAAEGKRLEKALAKLEKEVKGLTSKLGNEKFLAKAPAEVIEEQRTRLAAAGEEADKLRAAQERVKSLG